MMRLTRSSTALTLRSEPNPVFNFAIEDVGIAEETVDCAFTDPPYDDRTQSNVRRGHQTDTAISEPVAIDFDPATAARRATWAAWLAAAVRRWVGVFSDHESSMEWAGALERSGFGMVYVRPALWIRTGHEIVENHKPVKSGAPQFTGDRPAAGHEVIVLAHKGRRMRWNGRGRTAIYTAPIVPRSQRIHKTQKPVSLMVQLLKDFCEPGETVVDPFIGSGTTGVAAKQLGLRSIGIELSSKYADYARRRIAAAQLQPNGW